MDKQACSHPPRHVGTIGAVAVVAAFKTLEWLFPAFPKAPEDLKDAAIVLVPATIGATAAWLRKRGWL